MIYAPESSGIEKQVKQAFSDLEEAGVELQKSPQWVVDGLRLRSEMPRLGDYQFHKQTRYVPSTRNTRPSRWTTFKD